MTKLHMSKGKGAKVSPAAVTTSAPSNTGAQTGVAFAAANWSEANASAPFAASSGRKDPRWDVVGFDTWLAGSPCVRVGFLRATKPVGRHQVPEDTWVRKLPPGAGIDGVQLYAILSAAFGTQRSPDLAASELAALLQVLEGDQVHEDDLVWWDWLALSADDGDAGRAEAFRAFTTYKAQCVVLPTIDGHGSTSVFACMEPMALLALSCFCQRIYNASDEEVKAGLDLSKFFDLSGLLMSLQRESDSQLTISFVAEMLEKVRPNPNPSSHSQPHPRPHPHPCPHPHPTPKPGHSRTHARRHRQNGLRGARRRGAACLHPRPHHQAVGG